MPWALRRTMLNGADTFVLEWTMNLTDGRSFSGEDVNGNVSAVGAFYSSPYSDTAPVVCLLPETLFTGTYLIEQQNDGNYGAVFPDGEYEVISLTSTERRILCTVSIAIWIHGSSGCKI